MIEAIQAVVELEKHCNRLRAVGFTEFQIAAVLKWAKDAGRRTTAGVLTQCMQLAIQGWPTAEVAGLCRQCSKGNEFAQKLLILEARCFHTAFWALYFACDEFLAEITRSPPP